MNLSPEDRAKVLALAAAGIVAEIRKGIDLAELVILPVSAVAPMLGMAPRQVVRVMPTRPMGTRKQGVSLKSVQDYLTHQRK